MWGWGAHGRWLYVVVRALRRGVLYTPLAVLRGRGV